MESILFSQGPANDNARPHPQRNNEYVAEILPTLPPLHQQVLQRSLAGQLSPEQIAIQLNLTQENVERILQEAAQLVKDLASTKE